MKHFSFTACLLFFATAHVLFAQIRGNDLQAVATASQAIASLTHGTTIRDVKLTADVAWISGVQPETGSGVLLAKGTSESRIEVMFSGGNKTEIRGVNTGPAGRWVNPDGSSGMYATHNCWTDAAWFFPGLSSLARVADSRFVFSYIGDETWNGLSTRHLRVHQVQAAFKEAARLSSMDFYLDPTSLLVLGVVYKTHPDNNMNVDLLSEVRFADYRLVDGIQVPFRIQRLQNGALLMDIAVSSAAVNTGQPDDTFEIY